jgi:hypothetical protein
MKSRSADAQTFCDEFCAIGRAKRGAREGTQRNQPTSVRESIKASG